jgi:hypothetical protein
VDHQCHRCNSPVEDGVPFCPKCGAPQIRVAGAEDLDSTDQPTSGNAQPSGSPSYNPPASWGALPGLNPNQVNWKAALPGAAIAGIAAGFLMLAPYISLLFFVWMFMGGIAAALTYRNRTGAALTGKLGAKIGALTGVFAFLVTGFFYVTSWMVRPDLVREELRQGMEMSSHSSDPATAKAMQEMVTRVTSPEGMPVFLAVVLVVLFGFLVVLCAAGGAAGSTIGRKNRGV